MPRVTIVAKARKNQGTCGKCGDEIKRGMPYKWWKFNFGARHVRCAKAECAPRASDLTQSAFLAQLYDLQDRAFEGQSSADLEGERDEMVSDLEALKQECEDNRSNIPDHLQDGDSGTLLQERADALDDAINELQGIDTALEGEDDEPEEPMRGESDKEGESPETEEAYAARCKDWQAKHDEWDTSMDAERERVQQELADIVQNISC